METSEVHTAWQFFGKHDVAIGMIIVVVAIASFKRNHRLHDRLLTFSPAYHSFSLASRTI